jgi:transposase-like protein
MHIPDGHPGANHSEGWSLLGVPFTEDSRESCLEKRSLSRADVGEKEMTITEDRRTSLPEGLILCGLEKQLMEYLIVHSDDRFLTSNRLSLALGSNELLVSNSLKTLTKAHLVSERVDSSMSMTTYRVSERPNDPATVQIPKVVTPMPTVTEKDASALHSDVEEEAGIISCPKCQSKDCIGNGHRQTEKGPVARYICKVCGFRFSEGRIYSSVGRPKGQSKESVELDAKIKILYPAMQMDEIASKLGVDYGTVRGRVTRLRQRGEIKEYSHYPSKQATSTPKTKAVHPSKKDTNRGVLEPPRIQVGIAENRVGTFNIGQLLKVNSENQVAIVNATLEVIDEHGSQYEVTITRTGKGVGGQGPIPIEFSKEIWNDLDDALDYHGDYLKDMVKDEDLKEDDLELHKSLARQLDSVRIIRSKIRRDVGISEEKNETKE